jgi:hypothetical protein
MKLNANTYAGHIQKGKAVNKTANDCLVTELYAGEPPRSELIGRITFEYDIYTDKYTLIYYPVMNHIAKGRIILEDNIEM